MAKKVAKIPLGDDFLAGYKPVTPDFADIPMDNDVAPDPLPQSNRENVETHKSASISSFTKSSFDEIFMSGGTSERKSEKVYLTSEHLICLKEIVQAIQSSTGKPMTIGNYMWNIIEHHFSTYKKDIAGLLDRCKPNSLEKFK